MHNDTPSNSTTRAVGSHPTHKAVITPMESVVPRNVQWLWPGWVPLGKLTLLAGDPGLGKSFLTLDLTSRVSTGVLPGVGSESATPDPQHTLILSAEDDPADTIRPRLDAMYTDLRRVHTLDAVSVSGKRHAFRLDSHLKMMGDAVREIGRVRLIIVDPISAYLGKTDSHNNAEVREVLAELSRFAQWSGAAVVCVTHLSKGEGKRAVYRAMGSLAFTAAARVVLLAAKHPDDPEKRVLAVVKSNLARDTSAKVYRVQDNKVVWLDEPVDFTADELDDREEADRATGLSEACAWLESLLQSGPVPAGEVREKADAEGQAWMTVRRAKSKIGVVTARSGFGSDGCWTWSLGNTNG